MGGLYALLPSLRPHRRSPLKKRTPFVGPLAHCRALTLRRRTAEPVVEAVLAKMGEAGDVFIHHDVGDRAT